ncbi:Rpn family recombination-promoting nuclease/putative transposase [Scytonema sp. UIC 10036]|uniref:Rpn family recombination-promoting nuclease/putative transposase n=1 Tax=Scytonema sp. UIC 10036 TaxID=2304196 RepID=UPI0012DA4D59|nr:Rpn family recombination-promoting nuclease/putative transposase [Scytonema sp. UIC 10036]MUG92396.1 Rpn family recombination-promoting nuclease/putative transposase [Scytonema sp. UIC 10036]
MKTDSIFYRLFQTFPEAFFELISQQKTEASAYDFASVELKQTAFRIDGIFLPTPNLKEKPIFFVEVQFQKDPELYARLFSEIFLYIRLYAPTKKWRAVVIFARRSMEPKEVDPFVTLLGSEQVTCLYLNELGDIAEQSLGVGIMKLVVETKKRTPRAAQTLVDKARTQLPKHAQQQVLDLIETIVLYKLPRINRQELAKMFRMSDFDIKKTRYYEEVREEVKEEVREEVKEEVREEVKEEAKQEEALQLILRQLERRIGGVTQQLQQRMARLSVTQLENLALALLDFSNESDLLTWLQENSN